MSVTTTAARVQPRPRWTWRQQFAAWDLPRGAWEQAGVWPAIVLVLLHLHLVVSSVALAALLVLVSVASVAERMVRDRRTSAAAPPHPGTSPAPSSPARQLLPELAPIFVYVPLGAVLLVDPSVLNSSHEPGVLDHVAGPVLLVLAPLVLLDPARLWRDARRGDGRRPRATGQVVGEVDGEPVVAVPGAGRLVLTEGTRQVRHLMQGDVVLVDGVVARRSVVAVTAARGVGWARVRRILAAGAS